MYDIINIIQFFKERGTYVSVTGKFLDIDDSLLKIMPLKLGSKIPANKFNNLLDIGNEPNDYAYVVPQGYIVLDFDEDNPKMSGQLPFLKEYTDKTTWFETPSGGVHLWYRLPNCLKGKIGDKQMQPLVNGMKCDIKASSQSTVTIRQNNRDRVCHNPRKHIPELPIELYPLLNRGSSFECAVKINEGERNSYFYKHLMACGQLFENLDVPVSEITLTNIAQKINSMIPDSLGDEEFEKEIAGIVKRASNQDNSNQGKSEIEVIAASTDDTVYTDNPLDYLFEDGKKNFSKIAGYLKHKFDIYYYRGRLYLHDKTVENVKWVDCDRSEQSYLLGQILYRKLKLEIKMSEQKDIFDRLIFSIDEDKHLDNNISMPIVTKNGYVIHQDGRIEKNFSIFSDNVIDTNYNPNLQNHKYIDDFLRFITDGSNDMLSVLKFMLGHCLCTMNVPQLGYFLVGLKGGNGKSTFTECISRMLGDNNINSSSLEQLSGEDSHKFEAAKKLVNLADDVDGSFIESASMFKTFSGGSKVSVRQLFANPILVQPYCTMISSCNIMPVFKEMSGGMERRIVIIPFNNSVPENERDPNLIDKMTTEEAKSYWLNLALQGFYYLKNNNNILPRADSVISANLQYKLKRDSVLGFLYNACEIDIGNINHLKDDETITKYVTNGVTVDELYKAYTVYCEDEGIKYSTFKNSFISKIQQTYGLRIKKRADGKKVFIEYKSSVENTLKKETEIEEIKL